MVRLGIPDVMAHCPHCEEEVELPNGKPLRVDEFFTDEADDVATSIQQHVQLECPECEAILGYLAAGAATGG